VIVTGRALTFCAVLVMTRIAAVSAHAVSIRVSLLDDAKLYDAKRCQ
jgi:hypothetical protein